ncbi:hypothetical protein P171DRAFT_427182 [Karstenula rhodostoma CBS 690.94]|uniref:Uncharacterized protein n=1 Tax=Karstenula rhodostoma CBS 690.94 TaxID=1392251 RepID=A0A9P4PVB6_9PLEO|nr:hypothetical protein P171DRAFT_427182 [Karstenula rhodostoma CBS 690.94]
MLLYVAVRSRPVYGLLLVPAIHARRSEPIRHDFVKAVGRWLSAANDTAAAARSPCAVPRRSDRIVGASRWGFEKCHVDDIAPQAWRWLGQGCHVLMGLTRVSPLCLGIEATDDDVPRLFAGCSGGFLCAQSWSRP